MVKIDIKELEGRAHYVVPIVMITVGVHNGSNGPIYYSSDALQTSVPYWNGRPVVVYHPNMYSNGMAGDPEVFNQQKIGIIFNTTFDGHRLTAEAWIDVERVSAVDNRVLLAIKTKEIMEVSTGLVISSVGKVGAFNGEEYIDAAYQIQPDHLAVLPDQVGACSIADGGGLCRNIEYSEALIMPIMAF